MINTRLAITVWMLLMAASTAFAQTLFIVSDLGRNGAYQQRQIAETMGRMADEDGPDAVLALGDTHHYMGVQSVSDPLWMTNYELIYSHPELQVPWLPVLGNHEYRGNTQAVIDYSDISRRWQMPARYYTTVIPGDSTSVRLVMIDTAPLIDKYRADSITYPDAGLQDMDAQLQWLDSVLIVATEPWIIVAGHHPVYADTGKDTSERADMQRRVGAILDRHHVDMYICGHIHNFQHIRPAGSPTDYVVNSSASLSRPKVKAVPGTLFVSGQPGFSRLKASPHELTLDFVGPDGAILHTLKKCKM